MKRVSDLGRWSVALVLAAALMAMGPGSAAASVGDPIDGGGGRNWSAAGDPDDGAGGWGLVGDPDDGSSGYRERTVGDPNDSGGGVGDPDDGSGTFFRLVVAALARLWPGLWR